MITLCPFTPSMIVGGETYSIEEVVAKATEEATIAAAEIAARLLEFCGAANSIFGEVF